MGRVSGKHRSRKTPHLYFHTQAPSSLSLHCSVKHNFSSVMCVQDKYKCWLSTGSEPGLTSVGRQQCHEAVFAPLYILCLNVSGTNIETVLFFEEQSCPNQPDSYATK